MKKQLVIEYDDIDRTIAIDCDDLSTFEALGLLEAAKAMVTKKWLNDDEEDE